MVSLLLAPVYFMPHANLTKKGFLLPLVHDLYFLFFIVYFSLNLYWFGRIDDLKQ